MSRPSDIDIEAASRLEAVEAVTQDAYDRYAAAFADRYFGTRALDDEMDAFLSLCPARTLLLDAGCGPGHQARYFASRGATAVGLDYSLAMLQQGRFRDPGLPLVAGDLLRLPFPAGLFDGVWARASLIHMDDVAVRTALAEFRRVVRSEGLLYTAIRQGDGEATRCETMDGVPIVRYFRFRQPGDWISLLRTAGFETVQSGIEDGEPEDWIWTVGRVVG